MSHVGINHMYKCFKYVNMGIVLITVVEKLRKFNRIQAFKITKRLLQIMLN